VRGKAVCLARHHHDTEDVARVDRLPHWSHKRDGFVDTINPMPSNQAACAADTLIPADTATSLLPGSVAEGMPERGDIQRTVVARSRKYPGQTGGPKWHQIRFPPWAAPSAPVEETDEVWALEDSNPTYSVKRDALTLRQGPTLLQ